VLERVLILRGAAYSDAAARALLASLDAPARDVLATSAHRRASAAAPPACMTRRRHRLAAYLHAPARCSPKNSCGVIEAGGPISVVESRGGDVTEIGQRNWRSGLARKVLFFIRLFQPSAFYFDRALSWRLHMRASAGLVSPDAWRALYSPHCPARRRLRRGDASLSAAPPRACSPRRCQRWRRFQAGRAGATVRRCRRQRRCPLLLFCSAPWTWTSSCAQPCREAALLQLCRAHTIPPSIRYPMEDRQYYMRFTQFAFITS
jgi:hypothetical protein